MMPNATAWAATVAALMLRRWQRGPASSEHSHGPGRCRGLHGRRYLLLFNLLHLQEQSADPADPPEGMATLWQSDGTGTGGDGDILIKITAGGSTKTATLVDFSGV